LPVATQFVHDGSDCDDEDAIEERENGTLRRTHVAPHVFEQKGRISAGRTFAVPHVFDQKGRVMFTDAGATLYFHDDDLGNTLALTDAAGNVVERYDYDDFGQPMFLSVDGFPLATNRSAVGNAFLFHGMEWDAETGLYRYDYDNRNTWRAGGGSYVDPQTGSDINARLNINNGMPNRISMNVTVPKQTQGATFGEKVNAGLQAAGSALASGAGQRAKIVEKATSGLKDTLKTQVIMAPGGGGGGGGFLLKKEEGGRHTPFQNGYGNSGSGGGSALAKPRDPWKTYWERHYHKTGHVTLLK
jgi:YD repeat-containing protein